MYKIKALLACIIILILILLIHFILFKENKKFEDIHSLTIYNEQGYMTSRNIFNDEILLTKIKGLKPIVIIEGQKIQKVQKIFTRAKYDEEGIAFWKGNRLLGILKFKNGQVKRIIIIPNGQYFSVSGDKGIFYIRKYDRKKWVNIISGLE
jgi:hypothetical protein